MALSLAFILMSYLLMITSVQEVISHHLQSVNTTANTHVDTNTTVLELQEVHKRSNVEKCIEFYKTDKRPPLTCGDGPYYRYYHERGYLIWPPIRYKTCNSLLCENYGDCIPVRRYVKFKWANVRKCDELGRGMLVERRFIRFIEEPECQCNCPLFLNCRSGHVWNPIQCRCVSHSCPPMQYFDTNLYKCVHYHEDEIHNNSKAEIP